MKATILFSSFCLVLLAVACGAPAPLNSPVPIATPAYIILSGGYRPLQQGDVVEGIKIGYQYILPSQEKASLVIGFGEGLIQFVSVKPELQDGLVAYMQDIGKEAKQIFAFDETNPNQKEPQLMTWDKTKPIEIAFVRIPDNSTSVWSVTEKDEQGGIHAAYKLIRRKDGGLRFVDGYDLIALNSFATMLTLNGGGTGLVFSSRLALLRLILGDPAYQRGENVIANKMPSASQYDARILKLDPTAQGLSQDLDWVLMSRPGPNSGLPSP